MPWKAATRLITRITTRITGSRTASRSWCCPEISERQSSNLNTETSFQTVDQQWQALRLLRVTEVAKTEINQARRGITGNESYRIPQVN